PRQAAFWPFAVFSPEWQAIRYALDAGVPVRFCDLPAAHQLALKTAPEKDAAQDGEPPEQPRRRTDPVGELAAAAGYDDPERWWEDVVEHVPGPAVFDALAEAITILRADDEDPDSRDAVREAHMRRVLRRTAREGFEQIAVVCGAWHVPALRQMPISGTTTRNAGGRTWWSTSPGPRSSTRWPRPSPSCGPMTRILIHGTRFARRTCAGCCAARPGKASSRSRSSAAPGTCPPCGRC